MYKIDALYKNKKRTEIVLSILLHLYIIIQCGVYDVYLSVRAP